MRTADPRYVSCRCCGDLLHLDNIMESELADVHSAVRINSKDCLLAAMPSCKIFDPMTTFASKEQLGEMTNLVSSGGVSIWKERDPVHLTSLRRPTATSLNTWSAPSRKVTAGPALNCRASG